jgi:hypothetical protein
VEASRQVSQKRTSLQRYVRVEKQDSSPEQSKPVMIMKQKCSEQMISQTKCHDLCRKINGDLTAVGCIQDVNIHEGMGKSPGVQKVFEKGYEIAT